MINHAHKSHVPRNFMSRRNGKIKKDLQDTRKEIFYINNMFAQFLEN